MHGLLHGPEPFGTFDGSRSDFTRTCLMLVALRKTTAMLYLRK